MQTDNLKQLKEKVDAGRGEPVQPDPSASQPSNVRQIDPDQQALTLESEIKTNDGFNLLGILLETAFFYSLFEYIADRQFTSKTRQLRVAKMRNLHPRVYRWVIRFDFGVRVIVVVAIVAAGIFSVWKVLS